MTILVVVAHPDDEVFMGGTIARFSTEGHRVFVGCFTDGVGARGDWQDVQARADASVRCARALGFDWLSGKTYPDQRLDAVPILDLTQQIERWIAEVHPALVYTHSPGDLNADHRRIYEAVLPAVRPKSGVREVCAFPGPRMQDFHPTIFWNVEGFSSCQLRAAECYGAELQGDLDLVRARSIDYGHRVGCGRAEGFECVRVLR